MWIFKKKISHDEFVKFKSNVKRSFRRYRKDIKHLNQKCEFLNKELSKVNPLSKRFSELQNQFTELLRQFTNSSVNRKTNDITKKISEPKSALSENNELVFKTLSHLEQKGFLFIGKLQNEAGGNWIPVGSLTTNLYPDRINKKIKSTVSNVLKKLIDSGLIIRERKGNYWFIRLTKNGFKTTRQELHKNQLKSLIEAYGR